MSNKLASPQDAANVTQGGDAMRCRWLLSVGLCAASVCGVRVWAARHVKAATIVHVVELIGGDVRGEVGSAQYRYLNSQPHHWRQYVVKN